MKITWMESYGSLKLPPGSCHCYFFYISVKDYLNVSHIVSLKVFYRDFNKPVLSHNWPPCWRQMRYHSGIFLERTKLLYYYAMAIARMGNLYLCESLFFGGLKRRTLPYGAVKCAKEVLLLKHTTCCGWFHVRLDPYVAVVQVHDFVTLMEDVLALGYLGLVNSLDGTSHQLFQP